jgi:hypothetical protein
MAYKAEHAVELGSGLIVVPVVYWGDDADAETLPVTVELARAQLQEAGSPHHLEEVVGDKGYHKADTIQTLEGWSRYGPTSLNRSGGAGVGGWTSPRGSSTPCTPTASGSRATADAAWAANAASKPNAASRTLARPAAAGVRGYAEW